MRRGVAFLLDATAVLLLAGPRALAIFLADVLQLRRATARDLAEIGARLIE